MEHLKKAELLLWSFLGTAAAVGVLYSVSHGSGFDPFAAGVLVTALLMIVGLVLDFRGFKNLSPVAGGVLSLLSWGYLPLAPEDYTFQVLLMGVFSAVVTAVGIYGIFFPKGRGEG
jgi:signal transduction histidine kinase